ncbi:MAG: hypothetical protein KatS3mg102_1095 [Planctomycetota bacterium]|nr:MAG: hypothetical protein KatS3mg102_1095 [Planctomycetota bacterium]
MQLASERVAPPAPAHPAGGGARGEGGQGARQQPTAQPPAGEPANQPLLAGVRPGTAFAGTYAVRRSELRRTRNGTLYLDLELGDRSGALPAKLWSAREEHGARFAAGTVVEVGARAESFGGRTQLRLERIRLAPQPVDPALLLPCTPLPVERLWERLAELHRSIRNPWLRRLLDAFLGEAEFRRRFLQAPAATHNHHPYVGGLLEHVVSLSEACARMAELYPALDRDLLLAGAFLHDIGKVAAYEVGAGLEATDHGRLTGHIAIGVLWLQERARAIEGFPEPLLEHLRHLILSHHGKPEWGSPVEPMTPEAIALHALDNLDAKLWACAHAIEQARRQGARWTEFVRILGTRIWCAEAAQSGPGEPAAASGA